LKEIYRIKNGTIESDGIKIPFFFGIVFSDEGFIRLDIYVNEDYDLAKLMDDENKEYWQKDYKLKSFTEDNNHLLLDELRFSQNSPHRSRIKMVCYGKMEHIKEERNYKEEYDLKEYISYLLIEGLKVEFTDFTEEIRARAGKKIKDFNDHKRDHITTNLVYKLAPYSQTYYQQKNSEDIVVEFTNEHSNMMSYELFLELKRDYVSALSFVNGSEVRIRKECHGTYRTIGKVDAEKVVTYSFRTISNDRNNKYLPINDHNNRSERVLTKLLMFSFDNFVKWNREIDLNSIIFYLSNSQQSKSIEEKVFIQIIAFERLSTMYVEYLGQKEEFLPSNDEYKPIKEEFLKIAKQNEEKFGNAYNTIKSKLGNLNQIKRHSTTDKMYRIINDFKIPINSNLEQLIDVVRHKTVHRGDIGEGKEAVIIYHLLDELIREILLRMIEYKGNRNSLVLLKE